MRLMSELAPSSHTIPGPRRRGLRFWAICTLVVFYAIYPVSNWLASQQAHRYDFITPWDALIPLVPEFIWVYFSFFIFIMLPIWLVDADEIERLGKCQIIATLVCGLVFALLPANLAFDRSLPEAEPYRSIFSLMFMVDKPHNLLPSLHIVYTVATALAICKTQWALARRGLCAVIVLWSVAICASTMLVHQHHVLDVATAVLLVLVLQFLLRAKPASAR